MRPVTTLVVNTRFAGKNRLSARAKGGSAGKKKEPLAREGLFGVPFRGYIMSGDMPPGIPEFFFSSGTSVTIASVVSTIAAIDAAFCSADLVTLAGSTMPASNMFTNLRSEERRVGKECSSRWRLRQ